jgi:tetratricopeptide (TPR) repeat protein
MNNRSFADENIRQLTILFESDPPSYVTSLASELVERSRTLAREGHLEEALDRAHQAVDICRKAIESGATSRPQLADSLNNLGIQLAGVGRSDEALAPIEEAVAIRRELAQEDPGRYNAQLANALYDLGHRLGAIGRRDDAVAATEEAVAIRRGLAQEDPGQYNPPLASALYDLGHRLVAVGRRDDALVTQPHFGS